MGRAQLEKGDTLLCTNQDFSNISNQNVTVAVERLFACVARPLSALLKKISLEFFFFLEFQG